MKPPPVTRDLDLLVPAFRARVDAVVAEMNAEGFDAIVHETYRTPERGAFLEATGKSKNGALSMHCFWCAADIISKSKLWNAGKAFWQALGRIAKKHGLVWGGDFKSFYDGPHVQAVPVSEQNAIRALKSRDEIAEYVRQRLEC